MNLSKQALDLQITDLVQKGLARTRAEIVNHINTTLGLKGDDAVGDRDSDNALKRLSVAKVLSFNKTTKQWDALTSATPKTAEVPSTQQAANKPEGTKMEKQTQSNIGDIDNAINAAKSKKTTPTGEAAPKRAKLSAEERVARDAQNKVDRDAKRVQREAIRADKKATREAAKSAPHMSKVDKAAEKLPVLTGDAEKLYREITVNSSRDQITALAAHLTHFNRIQATERALKSSIKTGDTVKIVGGDARYLNRTGTVDKAQRIRCYVVLEGINKPVYLFTSDVEVLTAETKVAANG